MAQAFNYNRYELFSRTPGSVLSMRKRQILRDAAAGRLPQAPAAVAAAAEGKQLVVTCGPSGTACSMRNYE